jgi:hypothetical protein
MRELDRDREAITGVEEWYLSNDQDRVLMADDWFADRGTPHLYGMHRGELGVIGDPQQAVTRYRRLQRPPSASPILPGPYDAAMYGDRDHLVEPDGHHEDGHKTFDYLFGNSNVQSELLAMGALAAPLNDDPEHRLRQPAEKTGLDNAGRVWSSAGAEPRDGIASWRAGLIRDGVMQFGPDEGKPDWKPYHLRGLAVNDAWGHEVLYSITATGAVVLQSGGQDGSYRFSPGLDRYLQTSADAVDPAGDDQDCASDNLRLEMVQ